MCGIAGILSLDGAPPRLEELQRMCAALVHRGPDDEGFYVGDSIGLGMRRLSIIDLATGRQPVHNEDRSVWAVLNGEIYNYRELRRRLEAQGHVFATASDTETIVHLYEERGPACVEDLRGMFAFALWDDRRRRLLVARDRLGIKPVYFATVAQRLVFASEMKAILQLDDVERALDWGALDHVLTFLTTPPARSILQGIQKLEPGHLMLASPGQEPRVERYWDLRFEPDRSRREEEVAESLRERIEESVRLHLVSDVPVGAFLSGGIDSSSVVAAMARRGDGPVRTFAIGFTERDYDELAYARLVARRFGTEHHELVLEPDALDVLDDIVWHLDEPFGDPSAIPTYMVSRLAAEHVKVVLSGDGGDELFGGYDKYRVEARERRRDRLPGVLRGLFGVVARAAPDGMRGRNFLGQLSRSGADRYLNAWSFFNAEEKRKLLAPEALARLAGTDPWHAPRQELEQAGTHWLSALQRLDIRTYLPLDILAKVDRMSMAHSIEARVPLLDHELVEFAATIPPEMLLRGGEGKRVFRRAMAGILPEEILRRPKRGFAVPLGQWFRGGLGDFVRDLLLSPRARERGIVNPAYVQRLVERLERGRPVDLQLWTLISLELWARSFLDVKPRPRAAATRQRPPLVLGPGTGGMDAAPRLP